MAAYRHWRAEFVRAAFDNTNPSGNFALVVAELKYRNNVGANLIGAGTASASSSHYFPASNAFDGSTATGWGTWGASNPYLGYLDYDFGAETEVFDAVLTVEWTNAPQAVIYYGSHDGITWDQVSPWVSITYPAVGALVDYTTAIAAQTTSAALLPDSLRAFAASRPAVQQARLETHAVNDLGPDGGPAIVAGEVALQGSVTNTPVSRRVRLHDAASGRLLRQTWSDAATGAYAFEKLPMNPVYVIAFDHTHNYNAVIDDNITPVLPT